MITINNFGKAGRLGNQIFQYALLFYLNKTKGYDIHLPLNTECQFWNCFDIQNISIQQFNKSNQYRIFNERYGSCNFDALVFEQPDNTIFDGYYQSYLYFDSVKTKLIESLKFKQSIIQEGDTELLKYKQKYTTYFDKNLVSMHIRRTDYLDFVDRWGDLFSDGFYNEATKSINDETENVLIFTDDNDFARQHFTKPNYHVIDKNEYVSLYMMTRCNRHIMSNSSFAWWGAYLSGNDNIICPRPWWNKNMPAPNHEQKNITKPEWQHINSFHFKGR